MTAIVITSKDAERIAKTFAAMVGPKGLARMRRKTVNSVGSDVRRGLRTQGPGLFGTSQAALSVRGKAAGPGQSDPAYRLRMARAIPVARLKAKHRRIQKKGGRQSLTIKTPATDAIRFSSIERVARAFKLFAAGPLPERFIGGVPTRARTAFGPAEAGGYSPLNILRRRAALYLKAIDNLWNASISAVHVSLYAITLSAGVEFQLDPSSYKGELADFLEAGVSFQIADDPGADVPEGDFPLPQ